MKAASINAEYGVGIVVNLIRVLIYSPMKQNHESSNDAQYLIVEHQISYYSTVRSGILN